MFTFPVSPLGLYCFYLFLFAYARKIVCELWCSLYNDCARRSKRLRLMALVELLVVELLTNKKKKQHLPQNPCLTH
ncbi:hypothetical protein XELAEV_18009763mg [Xenopus laevis]|uniref:Uncharacterized protein n=1 Tax=Xenopus laevis TaxID=8355 RepID=A0A974I144_XENLA|nr:hypothetical protein XELAEV_18009763mg [Xenopus laevis]